MSTISPSLQIGGVNGWKGKEGAVLGWQQTSGGLFKPAKFDFSRLSGSASYVDENGLIQIEHRPNYPRFTYQDGKQCLMNEEARTNLIIYSEDFTNANWIKTSTGTGSVPVVTSNAGVAPDGTTTADRVVFDASAAASDRSILRQRLSALSTTAKFSFYAKSNTSSTQYIIGHDGSTEKEFTLTTEWQRFTFSADAAGRIFVGLEVFNGTSTETTADILLWGFQAEDVNTYESSYIPTSGSAVTRAAESIEGLNLGNFLGDSEGGLYVDALSFQTTDRERISLSDGTTANRFYINIESNGIISQSFVASVGQGALSSAETVNPNQFNKYFSAYALNNSALCVNGETPVIDSSCDIWPSNTLNRINAGNYNNSNNIFRGLIHEIKVFDQRPANSQMETQTT